MCFAFQLEYQGKNVVNVDAEHVDTSNYIRWINCARNIRELNVDSHQCYGKILYRTRHDVKPGTELLVFYGFGYARRLNIDVKQFFNKTHGRLLPVRTGLWYSNRLKSAIYRNESVRISV